MEANGARRSPDTAAAAAADGGRPFVATDCCSGRLQLNVVVAIVGPSSCVRLRAGRLPASDICISIEDRSAAPAVTDTSFSSDDADDVYTVIESSEHG